MPMKLTVGLSRKLGLPDYGSIGASCQLELELDQSLLQADLDVLRQRVHQAYTACSDAIQEELTRQQTASPASAVTALAHTSGNGHGNAGNGHNGHGNGQSSAATRNGARRATTSQVRAIYGIANRLRIDLAEDLQEQFQVARPEDLSIIDASTLIDRLKSRAATAGAPR